MLSTLATPWKITNRLSSLLIHPFVRLLFKFYDIPWNQGWRFFGVPIIQKHRNSLMRFGAGLQLRSTIRSNPLGSNRPVILATWKEDAVLEVGQHFAMTGGTLCAFDCIKIGNQVALGANTIVVDTDFHPLDPEYRLSNPRDGRTAKVVIEDNVFIGMNCIVLKGVTIGEGSVIGAGSVVARDIPHGVIAAGNPVQIIRKV